MFDSIAIVPVAAAAYIATNLDNLTLLVTLLARYREQRPGVVAGFIAGMSILVTIGFLLGEAAETAPLEYLGFLGVIPIAIGGTWIIRLLRGESTGAEPEVAVRDGSKTVFTVTLMTQLGNGTDTVLTLGVLFADSNDTADFVIVATMVAMALLFLWLASWGVNQPAMKRAIDRYAAWLAPFIMIAVGIYIVSNTATDVLPG